MANRQLADLPNELLDHIFSYLQGDYASLKAFLSNRRTHSSAEVAIWNHVDVSVREQYYRSSPWPFPVLCARPQMQQYMMWSLSDLNTGHFRFIRSLKLDLPVSICGCPPLAMLTAARSLTQDLPGLRSLDIAFLHGLGNATHFSHARRIYIPRTVRELTINHPRYVRWRPEDLAMGARLDKLTFRALCSVHEAHAPNFSMGPFDAQGNHSIFNMVKEFRYEIVPNLRFCYNNCSSWKENDRVLRDMLYWLARLSNQSLSRLEISFAVDHATPFTGDALPPFLAPPSFLTIFCNLKHFRMPVEMIVHVLPNLFMPIQDITFKVMLDPRHFKKEDDTGYTRHFHGCVIAFMRSLTRAKVFLDVQHGDKRKIKFVMEEYPGSWIQQGGQFFVRSEQALNKWLFGHLKVIGPARMREWLREAPDHLHTGGSIMPPEYLHVEQSLEHLEYWVSQRSKSPGRSPPRNLRRS